MGDSPPAISMIRDITCPFALLQHHHQHEHDSLMVAGWTDQPTSVNADMSWAGWRNDVITPGPRHRQLSPLQMSLEWEIPVTATCKFYALSLPKWGHIGIGSNAQVGSLVCMWHDLFPSFAQWHSQPHPLEGCHCRQRPCSLWCSICTKNLHKYLVISTTFFFFFCLCTTFRWPLCNILGGIAQW